MTLGRDVGEAVSKRELQRGAVLGAHRSSVIERLKDEEDRLVARLADIREALAALEVSPEVLRAVEALNKVGI